MAAFPCALLSYCALTYALNRLRADDAGVALALLALGAAMAGLVRGHAKPVSSRWLLVLALVVALEILAVCHETLAHYLHLMRADRLFDFWRQVASARRSALIFFLPCLFPFAGLVALFAVTSYAMPGKRLASWRFPLILAAYVYLSATLLIHLPGSGIDVWQMQQMSCQAILDGKNPYSGAYPIVGVFPQEVIRNGKLMSYSYPPLTLMTDLPGYLAGDVRWSVLVEMLAAGVLVYLVGRAAGLPAGHPGELAAAAIVWHPQGHTILELAYVETLVGVAAGLLFWSIVCRADRLVAWCVGLLLGAKQYTSLIVAALLPSRRITWQQALIGAGLAVLTLLPFASDPEGLWRGLVLHHLRSPFRMDSLALPARIAARTGIVLPSWIGFGAAGLMLISLAVIRPKALSRATLGVAGVLLTFFVFGRQAHVNYYWLADYFLVLAMVLAVAEGLAEHVIQPGTPGEGPHP